MVRTLVIFLLAAGFAAAQPRDLPFDVATIRPARALNPQDALSGKMPVGVAVNGNPVTIRYAFRWM